MGNRGNGAYSSQHLSLSLSPHRSALHSLSLTFTILPHTFYQANDQLLIRVTLIERIQVDRKVHFGN